MQQFTLVINGKSFNATGFIAPGTNPNNGKAFEVYSVQSMVDPNGADVTSYLPVKDAKLRADELGARQAELDAKWEAHKAALVASNPAMTPAELDFHKSIFTAKPENRILSSNLTTGLTATIIDANGVPHEAYFMRESSRNFRTFAPKKVSVEACPF